MKILPFLFFLAVFTFSCKEKSIDPTSIDTGVNFYPVKPGTFAIYEVTYISRVPGGFDTLNYQLKEVVGEQLPSPDGNLYKLERFIKKSTQTDFSTIPDTVWTIKTTQNKITRTENNVPYIKLIFPVKEKLSWNGNAENVYAEDEYKITNLKKSFSIAGREYENTLTVVHEVDTTNLIRRDLRFEVFAREIGLIYKKNEYWNLDFNTGTKTSGSIFTQKLVSYGSN